MPCANGWVDRGSVGTIICVLPGLVVALDPMHLAGGRRRQIHLQRKLAVDDLEPIQDSAPPPGSTRHIELDVQHCTSLAAS